MNLNKQFKESLRDIIYYKNESDAAGKKFNDSELKRTDIKLLQVRSRGFHTLAIQALSKDNDNFDKNVGHIYYLFPFDDVLYPVKERKLLFAEYGDVMTVEYTDLVSPYRVY